MLAARDSVRSICANSVARVWPKAVARAGFDERFQNFPVHRAAIHALAQIRKRSEFPTFIARLQDRFHRHFTDALDGRQAKSDGLAFARRRKIHLAFVHVRAEHFDAKIPRFIDVLAQLGGVRHVVGHHRAEKFDRVIRLQIGGLIRDDGVGGGV